MDIIDILFGIFIVLTVVIIIIIVIKFDIKNDPKKSDITFDIYEGIDKRT